MRMIKAIILIACLCLFLGISIGMSGYPMSSIWKDLLPLFGLMLMFANLILLIQRYYHSKQVFNTTNVSTILLFSVLTLIPNYFITTWIDAQNSVYHQFIWSTFMYRSLLVVLSFALILIIFWIEQQKIHEKRLKDFAIDKEREAMQIELKSIQQQFKPHFLFNSLNSINALTRINPEEARKMIHLLSEFMRGAVRSDQSELIPLEQEIRHIKLYTDIEKVRFGERLSVEYNVDKELNDLLLPALILQPIIENAIKYGLYDNTDEVTIRIEATAEEKTLYVSVSNPFDSETQSSVKGTGFGLQSIEKKMLILYNQSHLLTVKKDNRTYTTTLKIPQS